MKYLYRSRTNKKIAGICAGFGEYFDLDPSIIRIVWLATVLLGGTGVLIYLICWLVIPLNTEQHIVTTFHPLTRSKNNKIIAGVCGGLGEYFQIDPVIFRLAFIVAVLALGMGILLYIILWIAVPSEK